MTFNRLGGYGTQDIAANVVADATPIPFVSQSGMRVWKTAGSGTSFDLYECDTIDGTYVRCYDSAGSAISVDLANGSVAVTADIFAAQYVKFVGATSATLTVVVKP